MDSVSKCTVSTSFSSTWKLFFPYFSHLYISGLSSFISAVSSTWVFFTSVQSTFVKFYVNIKCHSLVVELSNALWDFRLSMYVFMTFFQSLLSTWTCEHSGEVRGSPGRSVSGSVSKSKPKNETKQAEKNGTWIIIYFYDHWLFLLCPRSRY